MIRSAAATPDEVARHYDELDPFYRALWGEHVHHGYWGRGARGSGEATEHLVDLVAERLRLAPGDRVCDIGCGYGGTARRLAARHGARVAGLTLSRAQAAAAPRGLGEPEIRHADWLDNDFPDRAFDAVVAIESTEHMESLERCLGEAFRTLRGGGRIVVCAWLAARPPGSWAARHLLEPICREGRLAQLPSADDYRRLLGQAGFGAIADADLSRHVARTWTICLFRLAAALARSAEARRFLLDRERSNRVFALTLLRIRLAYALGAMRYGIFSAEKPHDA